MISESKIMTELLNETDRDILDNFEKKFDFLKEEPIILYGLGEKTKLLLDELKDFKFVALMDKQSSGITVFNLPVIVPDDVIKFAKHIIIVCKYATKDIIFNRISYLLSSGINIWYLNGEKLEKTNCCIDTIDIKQSIEDLIRLINEYDVISFDLFDTLILRKSVNPSDIFEYIENTGGGGGLKNVYTPKNWQKRNMVFFIH